jgi:hypothetical protein
MPVAVTLQLKVKRTDPPEGRLGMGTPAPLSRLGQLATKGQAATGLPPLAVQLLTVQLKPELGVSRAMAPSAEAGPVLVIVTR